MQNCNSSHSRHPYSKENLNSHAGFLCLTPKAQRDFYPFAKADFIPWCVDLKLFDGEPAKEKPKHPFFLATGKTGRDYQTLIEASKYVEAEIKIIGPLNQRPPEAPHNVTWINSTTDPPDQAIDYPTLRKWYSQCIAVCIPLSGDAEDTFGYTNLLEGMVMAKPILMTKSCCLHFNLEERGMGTLIRPHDSKGSATAMNFLLDNTKEANALGKTGRLIAEKEFSIERFEKNTISFLQQIVDRTN
jgi:glycosyltransferase involved in cell wall biosynthesis